LKTYGWLLCLLFMTFCFQSCHEKKNNTNSLLSLDDYASLTTSLYRISPREIREEIALLSKTDEDSMPPDNRTRNYYREKSPFLWIDRKGIDTRADSLLQGLQTIEAIGFGRKKFRLPQIEADLKTVRSLAFDKQNNRINKVMARLEYNLTKAYLRYVAGQGFGFMNPTYAFNHLDKRDTAHNAVTYHTLFDIKIKHADKAFYQNALSKIHPDSLIPFIKSVEPQGIAYHALAKELRNPSLSRREKTLVLVNMERLRWRMGDAPQAHEKYVLVNIPSYHLQAVDGQHSLTMRIAFGSTTNKTPLMISAVKRMDINPQWVMPLSIIKKSIIPRLGDEDYFKQRNYFIRHRETGEIVDVENTTPQMLESGDYFVIQRGGEGNALGRIIFRFDNNLAIYLHDTSSRNVFERAKRDVSHGCVRVEKPFDLAQFMLERKDTKLINKIGYSMNADVSPLNVAKEDMTDKMKAVSDTLDRSRLVRSVNVKPTVPIFILYFTMYPNHDGKIVTYRDVYGYDPVVYSYIKNYI
jgi:murein L,D-transpeptidase YcbB/YkuD